MKAVIQWQPCNNLEVQAVAEQPELTIRDAWEGEQHEVLPGTLPLPTPRVADPQPAEQAPEGATADIPAPTEAAAAEAPAKPAPVLAEAPAPVKAAPAVPFGEPAKPETPAAAMAAASGPSRRRSTTTSRSANGSKPSNGTARTKVVAAAATEVRRTHDRHSLHNGLRSILDWLVWRKLLMAHFKQQNVKRVLLDQHARAQRLQEHDLLPLRATLRVLTP